MEITVEWARSLAEELLAEALPTRWAHTQGVARQARALADQLGDDAELVEAAAWLHDIGYAPPLVVTGFHPLDGARYLRDVHGLDAVTCDLVAHHTGAAFEAEERELSGALAEFGPSTRYPRLLDALTAADMTTSPEGELVTPEGRMAEIFRRYGPEDPVHRAVTRSGHNLIETSLRLFGEPS